MKKFLVVASIAATCVAVLAHADTPVTANQGKPGNQGPWPVTNVGGGNNPDGGNTFVLPGKCSKLIQTNDAGVGTSPLRVPVNGGAAGRIWIQICNSLLNSSSTQCICSAQFCPGSVAVGVAGDVLATGDCATYNVDLLDGGLPCCVCNGAGSFLPSTECVP